MTKRAHDAGDTDGMTNADNYFDLRIFRRQPGDPGPFPRHGNIRPHTIVSGVGMAAIL
jgi:hypothetical protein